MLSEITIKDDKVFIRLYRFKKDNGETSTFVLPEKQKNVISPIK